MYHLFLKDQTPLFTSDVCGRNVTLRKRQPGGGIQLFLLSLSLRCQLSSNRNLTSANYLETSTQHLFVLNICQH